MTMNKELIKLAKEKDFLGYFPKEWEYNTKEVETVKTIL